MKAKTPIYGRYFVTEEQKITVSTCYCSYLKRSSLQAAKPTDLPCHLLDLLNKSSKLITTSSPSISHNMPWVYKQNP